MTYPSLPAVQGHKGKTPLVVLTAYTAPVARLLDPFVDILLVGDSVGMVLYGMENTQDVTLDMMVAHGKAVMRGAKIASVVIDMPVGTYESSKKLALKNAKHLLKHTGCGAVKLEGGQDRAEIIAYLTAHGIPVMAHVGLMPQRVKTADGYRFKGRAPKECAAIMKDALAVEKAGAFSVVLEGMTEPLARDITKKLRIPTIGIGASPACDGQVLVIDDMLGLFERTPRFVKRYGAMADLIKKAARHYATEVRTRTFPGGEHCYTVKKK